MKIRKIKSYRTVIALLCLALASGFVGTGVSALAAVDSTAVIAQNTNPIAENQDYVTFKNIAVRGHLSATDPDDDEVTFEIADAPHKGTVQSEKDGSFVYVPGDNKKGQDSFSYIAIDSNGNISNKAVVSITINKQTSKMTYADMVGNSSYYAALVLAEKGVFTGEKLGNEYFFRPDSAVTRGEFVAMCLGLSDADTLKGITRTGFSDDESIPMWVKPYVSTALMNGIISGYKDDTGKLVFAAQDPITFSEAAVVLNNLLKISDVGIVNADEQNTCPVWSYQAEQNLAACHVMSSMGTACSSNVSRSDAAEMLVAAMNLIKDRDNGGSLLNWAK